MEAGEVVRKELPEVLERLKAYAIKLAGRQDADDLLQAVAVRAMTSAHQFTPGTNLRAWVYVILRNEFYSVYRNNKQRRACSIDEVPEEFLFSGAVSQETVIFVQEVKALTRKVLVPAQRETLGLIVAETSYKDIASAINQPIGSVKSLLSRARSRMRQAVM